MSYDQWKTASPYDDELDVVEEAESWLKKHPNPQQGERCGALWAHTVIEMLLGFIEDEI